MATKNNAKNQAETWFAHSDLVAVRATIIGQARNTDGEITDIDLGTIPGTLRQFSTGAYGFNLTGKLPDLTLTATGVQSKGFQMSGNLVAVKSKEW